MTFLGKGGHEGLSIRVARSGDLLGSEVKEAEGGSTASVALLLELIDRILVRDGLRDRREDLLVVPGTWQGPTGRRRTRQVQPRWSQKWPSMGGCAGRAREWVLRRRRALKCGFL